MSEQAGLSAQEAEQTTPQVVGGGTPTAEQRRLVLWGEKIVADPLAVRRATAQQWQATTSAITGLFGAASIFGGDTAVAALAPPWSWIYGVLAALAICLAAASIWAASRAGQATLVDREIDLVRRQATYDRLVSKAECNISASIFLTAVAVLFLVGATGVRWYAPKLESPPTRFEFVQHAAKAPGTP